MLTEKQKKELVEFCVLNDDVEFDVIAKKFGCTKQEAFAAYTEYLMK